jgi:hypothetical protein
MTCAGRLVDEREREREREKVRDLIEVLEMMWQFFIGYK